MKVLYGIDIVGLTPLLTNAISPKVVEALVNDQTVAQPRPRTDEEVQAVCEAALYRNAEGQIGLPARLFWAALCEAGTLVQYDGKRKISTQNGTLLPQLLTIGPEFLVFQTEPIWRPFWNIVYRKTGRRKERIKIWRPRFDCWAVRVDVEIFERQIDMERVKTLFYLAGRRCGVGAFRVGMGGAVKETLQENPNPKKPIGHFGKWEPRGWNLRIATA